MINNIFKNLKLSPTTSCNTVILIIISYLMGESYSCHIFLNET